MEYFDIVFDGPPAAESGRFVEVENPSRQSIKMGEWIDRGDGTWALRIHEHSTANYSVYRIGGDNEPRFIAHTVFIRDAESILENWHAGFITNDGIISRTKNFEVPNALKTDTLKEMKK